MEIMKRLIPFYLLDGQIEIEIFPSGVIFTAIDHRNGEAEDMLATIYSDLKLMPMIEAKLREALEEQEAS